MSNPRDKVALDIYRQVQGAVSKLFNTEKHDQEVSVEWLSPQVQLQLEDWETVDHIDGDFTNDDITNLQIVSRGDNIRKSIAPREMYTFLCPVCGKEATKEMRNVRANLARGMAGPFCSRSCAGKYSSM